MNVADLPDESDTSDEDYIPDEKVDDIPSEIDEDDPISDSETTNKSKTKGKSTKNRNKQKQPDKIKEVDNEPKVETKTNVDDIWADFVKDTGFKSKTQSVPPTEQNSNNKVTKKNDTTTITNKTDTKPPDKVKVTQIFEFAGEEVKVEKEVRADSAEARLLKEAPNSSKKRASGGLSGIGNVLSSLTKKPKISTLEKTKLDWEGYKRENKIEEELETYNKGKDGYLERQDFLQRTDLRRFEIEKSVRDVERSKRFNSTL